MSPSAVVRAVRRDSWSRRSARRPIVSGSGRRSTRSRASRIASAERSGRVRSAPLEALLPILDEGKVAIVVDGDRFLGLITRVDLINYLRLGVK